MARKKRTKTVDKWKSKNWYRLVAPEDFENKELGEVPTADPKKLLNKIVKVSMLDIGGRPNASSINTKLKFRVVDVKGTTAFTRFVGHEVAQSYIKTMARRRRSVVDHVVDVTTKDGNKVRLKVVIITVNRITSPKKTILRNLFKDTVIEMTQKMTLSELMQNILFGKFTVQIYNKTKKIVPIKRVEIHKTEVKGTAVKIEKQ